MKILNNTLHENINLQTTAWTGASRELSVNLHYGWKGVSVFIGVVDLKVLRTTAIVVENSQCLAVIADHRFINQSERFR